MIKQFKGLNMTKEACEKGFIEVPFTIETKQDSEDGKFYEFSGYAATFGNIDKVDDICVKGCFADSIQKKKDKGEKLIILWQHQRDMPLGVYFEFEEDDKGLFVKGRMPKADTFVNGRVWPQMQVGSIGKMSIGFFIIEREFNEEGIRLLKELDLFEVSLVTIPANDEAVITDMKSLEEVESIKDVESYLKEKGVSVRESKKLISVIKNLEVCDEHQEPVCDEQGKEMVECAKELSEELKKLSSKLKQ